MYKCTHVVVLKECSWIKTECILLSMLKAGKIKLIIQIDETKGNPSLSHLKTISCLSIQSLHDSIMLFTVSVSTFSLPSSGNPSVLSTTGSKIWRMAYSTYVLRWYGTPIMFNKIRLTIIVSISKCSFTVLAPYLTINEWGWVSYEELWRWRRVLSVEAVGRGG